MYTNTIFTCIITSSSIPILKDENWGCNNHVGDFVDQSFLQIYDFDIPQQ
jgi:hypothetical protein